MTNKEINLIEMYSLSGLAAHLDIHPFDVARYLSVQKGGMPVEFRFTKNQISQIATGMGLQNWWSEPMTIQDDNPKRRLIRELARRIVEADWSKSTRADNLNRGLEGQEYDFVRKVINAFIKCKLLRPIPTLTGLHIQKGTSEDWESTLQQISQASDFPKEIEDLC